MHGAEELDALYRVRYGDHTDYRNRVWRTLTRHFFHRFIQPEDTVLDLGCGYGHFINNVHCRRKIGMDLNPGSRANLARDVEFFEHDCSERWPLPDGSLDTVFTSNFLEHLPTKTAVASALAEARRCLRRGGAFIAMGPNIKFTPGEYWDFWDHHVPLSENSLREALAGQGFKIRIKVGRFMPYTMIGAQIEYPMLFLRAYLAFPLAWRYFGRQFLVIANAD